MAPPIADSLAEESRSRLGQLPPDRMALAHRAIDQGLVDPARFGIPGGDLHTPLESVVDPVGLEAIVMLTGRPPMLVKNNHVVIDPIAQNAMGPGNALATLSTAKIVAIESFLPSIGRVEFVNHHMQWGGTGWVIEGAQGASQRWVVTNRHVAKLIGERVHGGAGVFLRSPIGPHNKANLDVGEEQGSLQDDALLARLEKIVFIAEDSEADCALLEITAGYAPAPLPLAGRRAGVGELVATIGYPAYDSRNEVEPMRRYFGDLYNVKRFAPGLVMQSQPGILLTHDCTTLGGNSGSPLISLDQKAVVGLHFAGSFRVSNSAVSVETLKQLQTGRLFPVTEAVAPADTGEAPADRDHPPEHFAGREGYDPAFLGDSLRVKLPGMADAVATDLAKPSDATAARPHEIRYTHFGVFYSRSRKTPRFTAVNIDGANTRRIKRVSPDIWWFDLRIDRTLQLGQRFYPGDLDRGHMVRREDPNWGDAAQLGNDDSFHYTNCALQHASLNRSKSLWQGLENYILDSARTEGFKACVFTGPIFDVQDPPLGIGDVQIPREFWKVVVMPKAGGGLHATGYLLSQGDLIRTLLEARGPAGRGGNEAPTEGFVIGAYRTFQVAIRNIEAATGLRWEGLADADPLARTGEEAVAPVVYTALQSAADLIL